MATFSESAAFASVSRFSNLDYLTCDEVTASFTNDGARSLAVGDYVKVFSNGASGNVIFVEATPTLTVKIARTSSAAFSNSTTLSVTVGATLYNYKLGANVTETHGTHNLPLQQLVNRDNYLNQNSGSSLVKVGNTISLRNGAANTTISEIKIDHTLAKSGISIVLKNGSGAAQSTIAVDHSLSYAYDGNGLINITLKNGDGAALATISGEAMSSGVSVLTGMVVAFPSHAVPYGWLRCNGANYPNSGIYLKLYNLIGYTFGSYGSDFRVPDLRGLFIRGCDQGTGSDIDDPWRSLGSFQDFSYRDHTHQAYGGGGVEYMMHDWGAWAVGQYGSSGINVYNSPSTGWVSSDYGYNRSEVRPRNLAFHYLIKYI